MFLAHPRFASGEFRVACHNGDNTIAPRDWLAVLQVRQGCCCCSDVPGRSQPALHCRAPSRSAPPLQANHVLVLTPQILLNMLDVGAAHFHQLALLASAWPCWICCVPAGLAVLAVRSPACLPPLPLPPLHQSFPRQVLDECHHAMKEHATNRVMGHYRRSERTTQVTTAA